MNPAAMMKLMAAKNRFQKNHPKFVQFLSVVFSRPIEEDTVIEITVRRPGEEGLTANIKVLPSDLELLEEIKNLSRQ